MKIIRQTPDTIVANFRIYFFGIILLIGQVSFSQNSSKYDSFDGSVQNYMSENNIPGFIACIVKDSMKVWSKSYGKADISKNTPMNIDAIMNIASISKTFTATAAMQLWERGLISLDTDINEYLDFEIRNPKYPNKPVTIFQLLTHTSSIIDGRTYRNGYICGDPKISLKEWIYNYLTPKGEFYDQDENFGDWLPGDKNVYSNVGFGLLGYIVEEVAKQPFNEYCKKHIFEPLGMYNTGWFLSEIDLSSHIKPYAYVNEKNRNDFLNDKKLFPSETEFAKGNFIEYCLYGFPNYPDGLVRTSVRELSFFLSAIMNGGELNNIKVLNKKTIDMMLSLQLKDNNSQGLCWHKFEPWWGHSGGDPGIATHMLFNPSNKIGIITFQNNSSGSILEIVNELYKMAQSE